jgi:hypothetical protein
MSNGVTLALYRFRFSVKHVTFSPYNAVRRGTEEVDTNEGLDLVTPGAKSQGGARARLSHLRCLSKYKHYMNAYTSTQSPQPHTRFRGLRDS